MKKKGFVIGLSVLMIVAFSGMAMAAVFYPPTPPSVTLPLSATCPVTVTVPDYAELSLKSTVINLNPGNKYCSSVGSGGQGGFSTAANFNATLTIALNHAGSHFATWHLGRGKGGGTRSLDPAVWGYTACSGYFNHWFWVAAVPTALELLTQPPGTTTQATITATLTKNP